MTQPFGKHNLDVTVLLLDIEGTTTPIDFVYQTLFPYARAHMAAYLDEHFDADDRIQLLNEYAAERAEDKPAWTEPPAAYLLWLMDQDRKSRGLKSVQGKIWECGYRDGSLRAVLFPDVVPTLRQWRSSGRRVYIYSSGSVQAQRLLFGYSNEGDVTPLIDGYFDTEVGAKREAASYEVIANRVGELPVRFLFISDIEAECRAASEAGMNDLLCIRPGNSPTTSEFPAIHSFDEIFEHVTADMRR